MAPLIGITTAVYTSPTTGWKYNAAYVACVQAIADVGGLPVLIPTSLDDDQLRALYRRVDGILLPGGGDINPRAYGEAAHPKTGNIDDGRDWTEIRLARWAVDDDLPIFGICRGHQLMNVALGGTLVQDIPSGLQTPLTHDIPNDLPRDTRLHTVEIDPTSRLAAILGAARVEVNSLHHQAVERHAPNVCVTAYAPDGVVEALELPDRKFALSVQWHPEDLYQDDPQMRRLFSAFVAAANGAPAT